MQPAELGWGSHEKKLPDDGATHLHGEFVLFDKGYVQVASN
jgi:homospermidine synthase